MACSISMQSRFWQNTFQHFVHLSINYEKVLQLVSLQKQEVLLRKSVYTPARLRSRPTCRFFCHCCHSQILGPQLQAGGLAVNVAGRDQQAGGCRRMESCIFKGEKDINYYTCAALGSSREDAFAPNGQTRRLIDYLGSSKRDGGGLMFIA